MKICRFQSADATAHIGILSTSDEVVDLSPSIKRLTQILDQENPVGYLTSLDTSSFPRHALASLHLLPPVDEQEVWAAGVTYFRSKTARMEESDFSATAYDRVYDAPRPEIFFKSVPEKVVGPQADIGIRKDAKWNVPEPELALVINAAGKIVGYSIGNDMSSRDIEGENLLYLPQAKVYDKSCALGPWIVLGTTETDARAWDIGIRIERNAETVFDGSTSINQIKREFSDLSGYLYRSQTFPTGSILLTGTGVVPDDSFTLLPGDRVSIVVSGIGELTNTVVEV